jgi:hypothetical protein
MTPIEIVLIVIGIVILVISMFLVDKSKSKAGNDLGRLTDEDINEIKKKVDLSLSDVSEEVLQTTEDKLSHLSNEKIIAVTDYSDQVLEKINQNHEEVIFLYNMLNEKEDELKNMIIQIESTKKMFKDTDFEHDSQTTQKENTTSANSMNGSKIHSVSSNNTVDGDAENDTNSNPKLAEDINEIKTSQEEILQIELDKLMVENPENNNKRILELYKQGNSIVEISKLLEIGQGEVKLVIDLFNKRR